MIIYTALTTPFPILSQSVVPCPVLTVASQPAYRFLRRQVRWSGIPFSLRNLQFIVIYRAYLESYKNFHAYQKVRERIQKHWVFFFKNEIAIRKRTGKVQIQ